ncbi:MAG: hypothetical protein A2542_03745 [Parcubacteria group bacterium RIFOXYD2_FULL_52_8]|nr:MAG: hypothetical protein A2542_03745 [Parcubacteria group bacterium RIFOXYD2_FULL_52_8]
MPDEPQQVVAPEPTQVAEPQVTPVAEPTPVILPVTEVTGSPQATEEVPTTVIEPGTTEVVPTQALEPTPIAPQPEVQSAAEESTAPVTPPPQPAQNTSTSAPQVVTSAPSVTALRPQAQAARTGRIQKKLDKIVEFVREKKTVKNDDIEKLLHVSDSTAQRYLGTLVKQGKLRRVGNRGSTHYELI